MKLVVLGAPGAGKGTQARFLAKYYEIPHISTGDILRDNVGRGTELGKQVEHLINNGQLIPDELAIDIATERLKAPDCKNGFIMDGFPRTLHQAQMLRNISEIDRVIYVNVADEIIIERMSGRITCVKCGAIYHKEHKPPKSDCCDVCGGELIQREDDKESRVIERLRIYHSQVDSIIAFYKQLNLIFEVNGVGDIKEIERSIVRNLEEKN